MSFMFYDSISLLSVDMSKWNINKVTNLDYMFLGCSSLYNLQGISKWDTTNINSMNSIFLGCKQLNPFPDITKLNIKNKINGKNKMIIVYINIKKKKRIRIFGEIYY